MIENEKRYWLKIDPQFAVLPNGADQMELCNDWTIEDLCDREVSLDWPDHETKMRKIAACFPESVFQLTVREASGSIRKFFHGSASYCEPVPRMTTFDPAKLVPVSSSPQAPTPQAPPPPAKPKRFSHAMRIRDAGENGDGELTVIMSKKRVQEFVEAAQVELPKIQDGGELRVTWAV